MTKYRLVPEEELLKILKACNKYYALTNGGVNNWEWYGEALWSYLDEFITDNNLDPDSDWNYDTIAEMDMYKFASTEF